LEIQSDLQRITQVLYNLLSNAIKFTSSGFIKFSVDYEKEVSNALYPYSNVFDFQVDKAKNSVVDEVICSEQEENIQIRFSVEDTGMGVNCSHPSEIFQFYSRNDLNDSEKSIQGVSLGLRVSNQLVFFLNNFSNEGAISYFKKEKGTVFNFCLKIGEYSVSQIQMLDYPIPQIPSHYTTKSLSTLKKHNEKVKIKVISPHSNKDDSKTNEDIRHILRSTECVSEANDK